MAMRVRWIDSTLGDMRFARRHALRHPLTSLTIIFVLAIGIGVHAAVYTGVQAVTTRSAPGIGASDRLVHVRGKEQLESGGRWYPRAFSYAEYLDIANRRDVFAATAGWSEQGLGFDRANGDDAGVVGAQFVTGNYFTTLGVTPILGTALPALDQPERGEAVLEAVIGYRLWETAFGASPAVIGQTVRLNRIPVKIVGVAPKGFNGAIPTSTIRSVWLPLSARATLLNSNMQSLTSRDSAVIQSVARLQPTASVQQADAVVRAVSAGSIAQMTPVTKAAATSAFQTSDVVALRGDTRLPVSDDIVTGIAVFGSIALLILLITCTNVSALVVGSATTRKQEIAIRLSLGASRARLVRQLMTESVMLAIAGGSLGLLFYWWITTFFASRIPEMDLSPDFGTALFTLVFATGTGLLFGLSPALHATRRGYSESLKESGSGTTHRSKLQRAFVVAQIVFTQPLLAGLAMLIALVATDNTARYNDSSAERIVVARFSTGEKVVLRAGDQINDRLAELKRTVEQSVLSYGAVAMVPEPFGLAIANYTVRAADRGTQPSSSRTTSVHVESTSAGYFGLLGIPMVQGRDLAEDDVNARDLPVVIDSDLARELWGNTNVIGKKFEQRYRNDKLSERDAVVVGVYDARHPTTRGAGTRVYAATNIPFTFSYLIRTNAPAKLQLPSLRSHLRADVPTAPFSLQTLADVNAAAKQQTFKLSGAAAGAGALVLLLASIGLYGVVALALGQRRREIGVRLALGARPQQVVAMLFKGGVKLSLLGLALGLPVSLIVTRFLAQQAELPNINLSLVGAAIAGVVLSIAAVATWLPARRAAYVDPVTTMRAD